MSRAHPHAIGLAFGAFLGLWHMLWAFLVFIGAAQWLINFVFRLHMIAPPYTITGFNAFTAGGLVVVTASLGYFTGLVIGLIWNQCVVKG